jgi:predicted nuclease of predicted toxin-antitoxin system
MRFLLDEHVWGGLIQVASQSGADALLTQTQLEEGASDEDVLAFAARERRI